MKPLQLINTRVLLSAATAFAATGCLAQAPEFVAPAPEAQPAVPATIPASSFLPIPAHAPSQRFGVATHMTYGNGWTHNMLPMIRALGVAGFRDGHSWNAVEKEKGVYKAHAATDVMFDKANTLKLEPLFIVMTGNRLYGDGYDPEAFARFANWTIARYKGKLKYVEVWNEPDIFGFGKTFGGTWNGYQKDGSVSPWIKRFAEFATVVTREIKKGNPDIKLVGYSANAPSAHRLFKFPELWKNLDILAIHPYPYKLPPEVVPFGGKTINERDGITTADDDHSFASMVRLFREGLKIAGRPDMPIWITETGYTTAQVKKTGLWQGFSEPAQAAYIVRLGILAVANGVDRTFFYDFYNDGNNKAEVEHNFGLVRRDYSLKPSYYALQRLCALMPGDTRAVNVETKIERFSAWPRQDGRNWEGEPIAYIDKPQTSAFQQPDGKRVVFLWQPGRIYGDVQEELAKVEIKIPGMEVVEVGRVASGEKLSPTVTRTGDTLSFAELPYGADPVYIVLQ